MAEQARLLDLLEGRRHQKVVLSLALLLLLVLEVMIYFSAAGQAGRISRLIITDMNGDTVYEAPGNTLTSYQKMLFEKTHGPLSDYQVHIETEDSPFPFRAWLSAAVGIPVGLIMLVAFMIQVYLSLMYGESRRGSGSSSSADGHGKMASFIGLFQGISIYSTGLIVLAAVLLFWMVPNFLGDFAKVAYSTIREFKWYFAGVSGFLALLIIWVIYLRYKLSKLMLENQLDLEKFKVSHQLPDISDRPMLPDSVEHPDAADRPANE